ncbi:unnamed protein product [Acanthoscelides obtectus]|uniref:Peptidase S1 domain-containing protein n=2 Tax=Acanthoscelides obtectus TaxID=200917 RepID=A0A9P0JUS8_ACAOB|nr:unnamed protein product [Acanthoscelides obtectus]CAH2008787.1 unnamed protein product [Acanthoscelides obtectus]CAK1648858.1 Kallikrein-7 [Acanthoscelides obtectus]CAK1648878.1 Kallikrein-7 [Acanthoscelides obtectus]
MFLVMLKLFCIFAVCYGRQPHKHKEEVIDTSISANGSPQQAYTVLLSLTNFNTVFCSGTLLNEYWVLTIATCLKRGKLTDITVHKETKLPNGTIMYTGKRFARIERAFIHQEFGVPLSTYNDLAILRLDRAIEIYENQTRIVLPTKVEDVEMKFRNQPLHMTRYCSIHNSIEYKDAFPQDRAMCNYPYNKASFNKIFCALFQEERKTKFKDASDKGGPVVSIYISCFEAQFQLPCKHFWMAGIVSGSNVPLSMHTKTNIHTNHCLQLYN